MKVCTFWPLPVPQDREGHARDRLVGSFSQEVNTFRKWHLSYIAYYKRQFAKDGGAHEGDDIPVWCTTNWMGTTFQRGAR